MDTNDDIIKQRQLKSFIKVGLTFIDIKQTIGFSFLDNPEGYIIIQFVYDSGRALNAFVNDRNEFSQFLLELEPFIDDEYSMASIGTIIDEVERAVKPQKNEIKNKPFDHLLTNQGNDRKPTRRRFRDRNKGDNLENEN